MLERALARVGLCVHREAHRTKLHLRDRVASIAALRCRGQPDDVTRLHRRQHALERDRREMVALVDDDLPVAGHEIRDGLLAHQALDHRDVDPAGGVALSGTDLPDLLGVDTEEHGELRAPLVEQRSSVHQDQRAAGTGGHQIRADDGLADARRGDENAAVAREKRTGRLILNRRECSDETQRKRLTGDALVDDIESDTETAEQLLEIGSAASG